MEDVQTWQLLIIEWLESTGHHPEAKVICDIYQAYDVKVGFIHNDVQYVLWISPYEIQLARDRPHDLLDNFYFERFDIQNPDKTLSETFEPIQKALDAMN